MLALTLPAWIHFLRGRCAKKIIGQAVDSLLFSQKGLVLNSNALATAHGLLCSFRLLCIKMGTLKIGKAQKVSEVLWSIAESQALHGTQH